MTGTPTPTTRVITPTYDGAPLAPSGGFFYIKRRKVMSESTKTKIAGLIVGLLALGSFSMGLFGMLLSQENRDYFLNKLKNIRKESMFSPHKKEK